MMMQSHQYAIEQENNMNKKTIDNPCGLCKHFVYPSHCTEVNMASEIMDYITGRLTLMSTQCQDNRQPEGECMPEGKYFELNLLAMRQTGTHPRHYKIH